MDEARPMTTMSDTLNLTTAANSLGTYRIRLL